ncbi:MULTISPECIES: hypothetical protein [unclassified Rhizobium]|uniref:hypothetical protein n=1 Tax=unclassified Rhizobium TaxID=2613769 RepID=UPI001ADB5A4F|nr:MULTISPECIES: hypothetical protein [unclassified Rhizobium]MBO9097910.1 hypothetical protein [Rhizobium sp. L58/93]MBO9133307.1 hypothetical protein [Rhizobium sp. B209b/85]MBO9168061.1 hypothetical protein [Rhizobium sp. L245/93]MBO9184106.1 hypothetical protein [Rhizobium sp. E27B/91]QXZ84322.1 hypothetical protein J5287_01825 [Rhizobium sp. K1/93]
MSHVSVSTSSYPYRGTLLRLDTNGDGLLSREEIAADQRPGIMAANVDEQPSVSTSSSALVSLVAKLMQIPTDGNGAPLMGGAADVDSESDAQPTDIYRNTYGQYALDDMAA